MSHSHKITRADFYAMGGFSNSKLYRKMHGRNWCYYIRGE